MNGTQTGLRAIGRMIALVTLFVWVGAFSVCTAHCALGKGAHIGGEKSESLPPCHGGPVSHDSGSDSKSASSFCFTIKSLFCDVSHLTLQAPDVPALLQPLFAPLRAAESDLIESAQLVRQSRAPDRVFTPEVYLGPAFRSHAPPLT